MEFLIGLLKKSGDHPSLMYFLYLHGLLKKQVKY